MDVVANTAVLTDLIINAAGGFQQEHIIKIECDAGQGLVEVTLEVADITQAI